MGRRKLLGRSPEKIRELLARIDTLREHGRTLKQATEDVGISTGTYYNWRQKYGPEASPPPPPRSRRRSYTFDPQMSRRIDQLSAANGSNRSEVLRLLIGDTQRPIARVWCLVCGFTTPPCDDHASAQADLFVLVRLASLLAQIDHWGTVCLKCAQVADKCLPLDLNLIGAPVFSEHESRTVPVPPVPA